jgi:hypothetical protein
MNERIRELANKAGMWKVLHFPHLTKQEENAIEKFAELIVRECVGVVERGSFLHDQAPDAIFARECSSAIKRHFGIEEGA